MSTRQCDALFDNCGPDLYGRNAFRLLAADVDAKGRRVKRKEKDLRAALDVDDLAEEYGGAFQPDPLPTQEELSQAGRALMDPQIRFFHEFFWFWPLEWGKSDSDEILKLIKDNKVRLAQERWHQIATNGDEGSLAAKHNLAVLGHLLALDQEQKILAAKDKGKLTREVRKELNARWSFSFKYWEALCVDSSFWSGLSDRVRSLDDPRLTTGFVRRFSQSLPIAFDNINADIAVAFCDQQMYDRARDHVRIMKATNAGDDDVAVSLRRVTEPLHGRIDHALKTATSNLAGNKEEGKERCFELFNTVRNILNVLGTLLERESQEYVDTCDRVAEGMLQCQVSYGNETKDWKTSLSLLTTALKVARGAKMRARVEENLNIVRSNRQGGVCWFCESREKEEKHSVTVTMKKSIRWRDIKQNPRQYGDALRQIASQFTSQLSGGAGQLNAQGRAMAMALLAATARGDAHAIVRALDTHMDDSNEVMSQENRITVPRCRTCSGFHSGGGVGTVGPIQQKLKTAGIGIEREAASLESHKKRIASLLKAQASAGSLRKWWQASTLESLHKREANSEGRLQQAKQVRLRLQKQLNEAKAAGEAKPLKHLETWPAVLEAKSKGFRVS